MITIVLKRVIKITINKKAAMTIWRVGCDHAQKTFKYMYKIKFMKKVPDGVQTKPEKGE